MLVYIGIDNGVTGSIAMLDSDTSLTNETRLFYMPVRKEQSYTKAKAQITRIDFAALYDVFYDNIYGSCRVFIERPYVNPKGFKATASALRALEATLIVIEYLGFPYQYVDSREWQKLLLPKGLKGAELKHASKDIGIRLFPHMKTEIEKQKDADALLIAEWARRSNL